MDEWIDEVREPDGLIRRDVALRRGVDPDQIMKALRTGRLRRVQRGFYVWRLEEIAPLALARAAVLASGVSDAVASHLTAARVHDLPIPAGQHPEHVIVPRNQRRVRRRELLFHACALGMGQVELRGGVPLTTPARTLTDLASVVPELQAVWAVDDALRRQLVRREDLLAVMESRTGVPKAALVRARILAADGRAESILETAGRLALVAAGVPLPVPQYEIKCDGVVVARLDAGYPVQRIGLEFDGKGVHSQPKTVFRDRWRQNDLHSLGWTVLRFTWWDVIHDPKRFVDTVRDALEATHLVVEKGGSGGAW